MTKGTPAHFRTGAFSYYLEQMRPVGTEAMEIPWHLAALFTALNENHRGNAQQNQNGQHSGQESGVSLVK